MINSIKKLRKEIKRYDPTLDIGYNPQVGCYRVIQRFQGTVCAFGFDILSRTGRPLSLDEFGWLWLRGELDKRRYSSAGSNQEWRERFDLNYKAEQVRKNRDKESENRMIELGKDVAKVGFNTLHKTTIDLSKNI